MDAFQEDFVENNLFRWHESVERIRKCADMLSEGEIWHRPNGISNSVGILILHLSGNIRQYIISSLGNKPDIRHRDAEFEATGGYSKMELLGIIKLTITEAIDIIRKVKEEEWLRKRNVQGFQLTGIGIMVHVTEHLSYHTGQIAFWTKQLKGQDLGFYEGIDLNKEND